MLLTQVHNLEEGMQIAKPVYDEEGMLLLGRGVPLNRFLIQRLDRKGVRAVFILDEDTDDIFPLDNISEMTRGAAIRHMKELFDSLRSVFIDMKTISRTSVREMSESPKFRAVFGDNPIYEKIKQSVSSIVEEVMNEEVSLGLSSIKSFDNYLFQHSIDTTVFAVLIGRRIGLSSKRLQELGMGCLLHDMGMIFIPHAIVNKPDSLTDHEFAILKTHTSMGYELTKDVAAIGVLPPHVAFQHHERQDGSGYPRGLQGSNDMKITGKSRSIHLYADICAVADMYDALASNRPFRRALPPSEAIDMMRTMSGNLINKMVFDVFYSFAPPFPVATNIKLTSGEYESFKGVVVRLNPVNLSRPVVRLLYNADGRRIDPVEIDLSHRVDIKIQASIL